MVKKIKKNIKRAIDEDKFNFIIDKLKSDVYDDKVLFNLLLLNTLLYYTGSRISEILLMNKNNIEELLKSKSFNSFCKKTQDYRTLYITTQIINKILNIFNLKNINQLIKKIDVKGLINSVNKKLDLRTSTRYMERFFHLLQSNYGGGYDNLKGCCFGFHSYRVNFINQVITKFNIDKANVMIGHKNINTTLIYFRKLKLSNEEGCNIIDNIF
jgi:integrase